MYLTIQIQEKNEREEAERKKRIQLYVFILRSVAYPFNAKQPSDMNKRHLKVTKDGHEKMKARIEVNIFDIEASFLALFFLYSYVLRLVCKKKQKFFGVVYFLL